MSSFSESPETEKQISLLDRVNEIIQSCVRLKDEKHVTGDKLNKANLIIEKAKEKERKILKKLEDTTLVSSGSRVNSEEGEMMEKEMPVNSPSPVRSVSGSPSPRPRSKTRSSSRSSRSWKREKGSPPRRGTSPAGRERPRARSRSALRRGRSRSRGRRRTHWIAVSPCIILKSLTLARSTTSKVVVTPKDQFWFSSNAGLSVKMTKWTGRDYIGGVHISPQIVKLTDSRNILIDVENPYDEKVLKLEKNDKLACLSVMTTTIPRFSQSLSPDR